MRFTYRAANERPAGFVPFQDEGAQIGAGSVDGGGQSRATTADDDDFVHFSPPGPLDNQSVWLDSEADPKPQ